MIDPGSVRSVASIQDRSLSRRRIASFLSWCRLVGTGFVDGLGPPLVLWLLFTLLISHDALIGVPFTPLVLGIELLLFSFRHQLFVPDHLTDDLFDLRLCPLLELGHHGLRLHHLAEMDISPPTRHGVCKEVRETKRMFRRLVPILREPELSRAG